LIGRIYHVWISLAHCTEGIENERAGIPAPRSSWHERSTADGNE
jgi:hypothetical protein